MADPEIYKDSKCLEQIQEEEQTDMTGNYKMTKKIFEKLTKPGADYYIEEPSNNKITSVAGKKSRKTKSKRRKSNKKRSQKKKKMTKKRGKGYKRL